MDCFETQALKTSYWPEITLRPTSQVTCDEFWCGNGINDDLFVEGLLDFSNEQVVHEKEEEDEYNDEKKVPCCCSSVSSQQDHNPKDEFVSVPGSELSVLQVGEISFLLLLWGCLSLTVLVNSNSYMMFNYFRRMI